MFYKPLRNIHFLPEWTCRRFSRLLRSLRMTVRYHSRLTSEYQFWKTPEVITKDLLNAIGKGISNVIAEGSSNAIAEGISNAIAEGNLNAIGKESLNVIGKGISNVIAEGSQMPLLKESRMSLRGHGPWQSPILNLRPIKKNGTRVGSPGSIY